METIEHALTGLFANTPYAAVVFIILKAFGKFYADKVWPQQQADWEQARALRTEASQRMAAVESGLDELVIKVSLLISALNELVNQQRLIQYPGDVFTEDNHPPRRRGDKR